MGDRRDLDRVLDALIESGIFREFEDGRLRPTESFQAARERHRTEVASLDEDELAEVRSAYVTDDGTGTSDVSLDALGDARAIHDTTTALDREQSLLAAVALGRLEESESAGGVPEGFAPLEGQEVDRFMQEHPAAVIYFWREECEPCDAVRESLETLVANGEIPESVGLGAVYGPDAADLVRDRYQVAVAPTTIFCVDGRIDSRIIGAYALEPIRSEIRTITDSID